MIYQINIEPKPTPRPKIRVISSNGRRMPQSYYPKKYQLYKDELTKLITELKIPPDAYTKMVVEFGSPYPKGTPKIQRVDNAPMKDKFDLDNVCKGVMDALQASGVIEDDRSICMQALSKVRTTGPGFIKLFLGFV